MGQRSGRGARLAGASPDLGGRNRLAAVIDRDDGMGPLVSINPEVIMGRCAAAGAGPESRSGRVSPAAPGSRRAPTPVASCVRNVITPTRSGAGHGLRPMGSLEES